MLLLSGCYSTAKTDLIEEDLAISIVDIDGLSFSISEVVWWYETSPEKRVNLTCDIDLCHTWILPKEVKGAIYITGYHSKPFKNDQYCAELFEGQHYLYIESTTPKNLSIEVIFSGLACS